MIATGIANELGLAGAMPSGTALGAPGGGVTGIERDARHASELALIFDEKPEFPEGPGVEHPSHPLWGLDAAPDAFKVLHGDSRAGFLGKIDDGSADLVVVIPHPPGFLPGEALQHPIGICRSVDVFLLKLGLLVGEVVSGKAGLVSPEEFASGKGGQFGKAEVDADHTLGFKWLRLRGTDRDMEIPVTVHPPEFPSPMFAEDEFFISWSDMIGKVEASMIGEVEDESTWGESIDIELEAGNVAIELGQAPFALLSEEGTLHLDSLVHGSPDLGGKQVEVSPCFVVVGTVEAFAASGLILLDTGKPPADT